MYFASLFWVIVETYNTKTFTKHFVSYIFNKGKTAQTSGCPTNPKSCGKIDLFVNLMVVFVDSYIVQHPKSISCTSNSMSELVTTAWTVNGTGAVWSATRIIIGASSTPVSLSKYFPASLNKLGLKKVKIQCFQIDIFFFFSFFLYFIWILWPIKIISLILSRVNRKIGWKPEIHKKKNLTTHKQNLADLTCDPSSARTQWWDHEQFRALKISDLNHWATEATY